MFRSRKLEILFVIIVFVPGFTFGQAVVKRGSIRFLTFQQGFGNLKLGSDINLLPYNKLNFLDNKNIADSDSCFLYKYTDSTMADIDGIIPLDAVCLRAYKGKIINIYVFFNRKDGYGVLRNFLSSYGLFTSKPNDYVDIYNWKSKSVDLSLNYEERIPLGMATFTWREFSNNLSN